MTNYEEMIVSNMLTTYVFLLFNLSQFQSPYMKHLEPNSLKFRILQAEDEDQIVILDDIEDDFVVFHASNSDELLKQLKIVALINFQSDIEIKIGHKLTRRFEGFVLAIVLFSSLTNLFSQQITYDAGSLSEAFQWKGEMCCHVWKVQHRDSG